MNPQNYLSELYKVFKSKKIQTKYLILGNTTCDIDSVLSAYILSIGKNLRHGVITIDDSNYASFNEEAKEIYFPVINCPRGEYKLRLDGQEVFKKFNIKDEDFLYINDLEISQEALIQYNKKKSQGLGMNQDGESVRIILVDHSILDVNQKYLANFVVEVYDHHMSLHLDYPHLAKKTIKYPCGSCTTLILVDYYLSKFPHSLISPLLACTAILLDTENFKDIYFANRWTEMDKMIYNHIMNQIQSKVDMNAFYNQVYKAKFNPENNLALGVEGMFTKDRKNFTWNGILVEWSSLQVSIFDVIKQYGMHSVIEHYAKYKGKIEFYICNSRIGNGRKIFLIYSYNKFDGVDVKNLEEFMMINKSDCIKSFKLNEEGNIIEMEFDSSQTRKLVEPFLNEYFQENPIERVIKKD